MHTVFCFPCAYHKLFLSRVGTLFWFGAEQIEIANWHKILQMLQLCDSRRSCRKQNCLLILWRLQWREWLYTVADPRFQFSAVQSYRAKNGSPSHTAMKINFRSYVYFSVWYPYLWYFLEYGVQFSLWQAAPLQLFLLYMDLMDTCLVYSNWMGCVYQFCLSCRHFFLMFCSFPTCATVYWAVWSCGANNGRARALWYLFCLINLCASRKNER